MLRAHQGQVTCEPLASISGHRKASGWEQLWPQAPGTSCSKSRVFSARPFSHLFFHIHWFRALDWESTYPVFRLAVRQPILWIRPSPSPPEMQKLTGWSPNAPPERPGSDFRLAPSVDIPLSSTIPRPRTSFCHLYSCFISFQRAVLVHGNIFSVGLSNAPLRKSSRSVVFNRGRGDIWERLGTFLVVTARGCQGQC